MSSWVKESTAPRASQSAVRIMNIPQSQLLRCWGVCPCFQTTSVHPVVSKDTPFLSSDSSSSQRRRFSNTKPGGPRRES